MIITPAMQQSINEVERIKSAGNKDDLAWNVWDLRRRHAAAIHALTGGLRIDNDDNRPILSPLRKDFERGLLADGFTMNMLALDQTNLDRYESPNIQKLWELYENN